MDLLLINPHSKRDTSPSEHLGLLSLKAFSQSRGYDVDMLDMSIEKISVSLTVKTILEKNPEILGLSMLDSSKMAGFSIIRSVRKLGYKGKIVLGGYFPTFSAADILRDFPAVDYIIRGEGELTLVDLLDVLIKHTPKKLDEIFGLSYREKGTIIENPARPLIPDLDILPPVDRKYAAALLRVKQPLRVYATRGCWGRCSFCDIIGLYGSSPGKQWRRRSSEQLVNELFDLSVTFGTDYFIFNDDQFLVKGPKSVDYAEEFAAELERRNLNLKFDLMCRADTVTHPVMSRLQSVGLQRVFLGLESFDPQQLQRYNKNITVRQNLKALRILYRLRIDVIASVILADAETALYNLLKQFSVLFRLTRRYFNSRKCQISVNKKIEIYRGSKIYHDYKIRGLLTKDDYLTGYDFRLKRSTDWRLKLLTAEETIGLLLFKVKKIVTGFLDFFRRLQVHEVGS